MKIPDFFMKLPNFINEMIMVILAKNNEKNVHFSACSFHPMLKQIIDK